MSRQRNGNGSITARTRADGTVAYQLRLQLNGDVHRSTHSSEKGAQAERDRLRRAGSLAAVVRQRKMMFPELMDMWMAAHPKKAGSTKESYTSALELHIRPRLNIPIDQVTGYALTQFIEELPPHLPKYAKNGRALARRIVTMSKACLKWASRPDVRLIEENLLRDVPVELPAAGAPRRPVPPRGFIALMEATAGKQSRDIWMLLAATGGRKGEITPLLWSDMWFHTNEVDVNKISTPESRGAVIEERVKMNQKRQLPMDPAVSAHFAAIMKKRGAALSDPVFPAPRKGGPIGHGTIDKWWHRDMKAAGLKGLQIHSLRHMFTTFMIDSGADLNVVSAILGHSSPMVTLSVYRHVTESQKKDAIKHMGGLMGKVV